MTEEYDKLLGQLQDLNKELKSKEIDPFLGGFDDIVKEKDDYDKTEIIIRNEHLVNIMRSKYNNNPFIDSFQKKIIGFKYCNELLLISINKFIQNNNKFIHQTYFGEMLLTPIYCHPNISQNIKSVVKSFIDENLKLYKEAVEHILATQDSVVDYFKEEKACGNNSLGHLSKVEAYVDLISSITKDKSFDLDTKTIDDIRFLSDLVMSERIANVKKRRIIFEELQISREFFTIFKDLFALKLMKKFIKVIIDLIENGLKMAKTQFIEEMTIHYPGSFTINEFKEEINENRALINHKRPLQVEDLIAGVEYSKLSPKKPKSSK
ncbi:hypothetical protein PACTADRAFT_35275 [Pachysolen tannophilus NRRL Y-2460]|uniref:Uncharacterized protein n=1 Tax=Pachysolen tannophilus NRRL Y-2460 TaxID=669874 RepID=A0A1E4TRT2_PACTA|nr:hypothetical protein PACTADRAFT_35275 [Pachysolen tannophilus NRRL Y-2460]